MVDVNGKTEQFKERFLTLYQQIHEMDLGYKLTKKFRDNSGYHPENVEDIECAFAAEQLKKGHDKGYIQSILDIGSYRHFVKGLAAAYEVTTFEVRKRKYNGGTINYVTGDAKELSFSDKNFDAIVSLCAIEHFGLGRYGDEFDIDADRKAIEEMKRVLKPGGLFVFSTTLKRGTPVLAFNAHRIYSYQLITELCHDLELDAELIYSRKDNRVCSLGELPDDSDDWHLYCGAWRKKKW